MEADITRQELQDLKFQAQTSRQELNNLQAQRQTLDNQISRLKNQNLELTDESKKKQQGLDIIDREIVQYQTNIQKIDLQISELNAKFNELNLIRTFMDEMDSILNKYSSIEGVRIEQSTMAVRKLPQNELMNSNLPKEICKKKCLDDFKEIVLKMKDINTVDSEGRTLLMHALSHGFYEAVDLLLQNPELNCNITDNKGLNALMYSCAMPHIKYVKLIADKTDNLNHQCKGLNNDSALHILIKNCRNVIFVSEFDEIPNFDINDGLNINSVLIGDLTIYGENLNININFSRLDGNLTIAGSGTVNFEAVSNSLENEESCMLHKKTLLLINYFLNKNADFNLQNEQGLTPLMIACAKQLKYIVNTILDENILVDHTKLDVSGYNNLLWSLEFKDLSIIKKFLKKAVDPNHQDNEGKTALFWACAYNIHEAVKYFLDNGADLNIPSKAGFYPIHVTAEAGNIQTLKFLLSNKNLSPDIKSEASHQVTPLWIAAWKGHLDIVKYLISQGADVNPVNAETGDSAVYIAVKQNKKDIVEYLLMSRANPNIPNNAGYYPIHGAIHNGLLDTVKVLIENNANINIASLGEAGGITPLYYAMGYGKQEISVPIIDYLLKRKADPNIMSCGHLPIHAAIINGHLDAVKVFIDNYININTANTQGLYPIHWAANNGNTEIIKLLIERATADVNVKSEASHQVTPLRIAAQNGHLDIVKYLISRGADANPVNAETGDSAITIAVKQSKKDVIEYLLSANADPAISNNQGLYPIHLVAAIGNLEILNLLIEHNKIDINIRTNNALQSTALHTAAELGHLELVKLLLERQADINIQTAQLGLTSFFLACSKKHILIAEYLLNHPNFDNSIIDGSGNSTLHWGIELRNKAILQKILDKGKIDINICDNLGKTTLFWASEYGEVDIAKTLLENRADPNIPGKSGYYPIHGAVHRGYLDIIKLLIENNADINIASLGEKGGITPLYYAMGYGGQKIDVPLIDYLLEYKANPNSKVYDGDTPMHMAGYRSRVDLIKKLSAYNGDLNIVNIMNETPLYVCIKQEDPNIEQRQKLAFVKYLLASGAKLDSAAEHDLVALANMHLPIAAEYLLHPETVPSLDLLEIELSGDCV